MKGEYNIVKTLKSHLSNHRWVIEQTQVVGPIITNDQTETSILNEMMMSGYINNKKYSVDFSYPDPLIISQEDNLPVFQLISMV